jgi:hypothetical protein
MAHLKKMNGKILKIQLILYQMKFQLLLVVVEVTAVVLLALGVVVELILIFAVLATAALVVGVKTLVSATALELVLEMLVKAESAFEVPVEPAVLEVLDAELGTKLVANAPALIIVEPTDNKVDVWPIKDGVVEVAISLPAFVVKEFAVVGKVPELGVAVIEAEGIVEVPNVDSRV